MWLIFNKFTMITRLSIIVLILCFLSISIFATDNVMVEYKKTPIFQGLTPEHVHNITNDFFRQYAIKLFYDKNETYYLVYNGLKYGFSNESIKKNQCTVKGFPGVYIDYTSAKQITFETTIEEKKIFMLVEDTIANDSWKIIDSTQQIYGKLCHMAMNSHGVIAWFCPDIAIPIGPCGFIGTPGLIFKLDLGFYSLNISKLAFLEKETLHILSPADIYHNISVIDHEELNRIRKIVKGKNTLIQSRDNN